MFINTERGIVNIVDVDRIRPRQRTLLACCTVNCQRKMSEHIPQRALFDINIDIVESWYWYCYDTCGTNIVILFDVILYMPIIRWIWKINHPIWKQKQNQIIMGNGELKLRDKFSPSWCCKWSDPTLFSLCMLCTNLTRKISQDITGKRV